MIERDHMLLWNHAFIKVLDVRHTTLEAGNSLRAYKLPSSMFMYSVRGDADVWMDNREYAARRYHVVHGGKGTMLTINVTEDLFECYMIFYKAVIPLPNRQEILELMERRNPFAMQYGFQPHHPALLLEMAKELYREWGTEGELERFYTKKLFYDFVYELLRQLASHNIQTHQPDLAEQAIRYIHEHYREQLTLESLAQALNYSAPYVARQFKSKTGRSLIEYLIEVRMGEAGQLLKETDLPLQEIAEGVGYSDTSYFIRVFKKWIGLTPGQYREKHRAQSSDNPVKRFILSDARRQRARYIVNDSKNHFQYMKERKLSMYGNKSSWAVTSLMLCLMLLLGACSGGAGGQSQPVSNAGGGASSPVPTGENGGAGENSHAQTESKTRKMSTLKGDIEVPANPERIVVLYHVGDVLAFGAKPVGVSEVYDGAAFQQDVSGIPSLGHWMEPSPEAVLALNPDLIIVPSEDPYRVLKDIAPTVYMPFDSMTLEERMEMIGKALGKENESDALLQQFYAKVESSKDKLREAGILNKTVTIMEGGKGNMLITASKKYGRGSEVVYEYLGMKAPDIIQKDIDATDKVYSYDISFEKLPQYAGDIIIRSAYEGMENLTDSALWNNLPAVKEGRLIELDFGLSYYTDIYSLDKQLDYIVDSLLKSVS
ncbi:AraC family transcriptional regulator [Paenibacillus paeoniae]|uniref:Helix-turn-helix domain-containing protein n=1 Tax=Paenibacillus paeoniae TaxID=2292705 RepID=A0A371PF61_9BACL|nr:AraC family transcriptional regulator [Paenibacillus paeoniae]REK74559.1 helix-turn-helix domain-containing protein [Paenibacillus paeoniae]